jgi:hypothetical protein
MDKLPWERLTKEQKDHILLQFPVLTNIKYELPTLPIELLIKIGKILGGRSLFSGTCKQFTEPVPNPRLLFAYDQIHNYSEEYISYLAPKCNSSDSRELQNHAYISDLCSNTQYLRAIQQGIDKAGFINSGLNDQIEILEQPELPEKDYLEKYLEEDFDERQPEPFKLFIATNASVDQRLVNDLHEFIEGWWRTPIRYLVEIKFLLYYFDIEKFDIVARKCDVLVNLCNQQLVAAGTGIVHAYVTKYGNTTPTGNVKYLIDKILDRTKLILVPTKETLHWTLDNYTSPQQLRTLFYLGLKNDYIRDYLCNL